MSRIVTREDSRAEHRVVARLLTLAAQARAGDPDQRVEPEDRRTPPRDLERAIAARIGPTRDREPRDGDRPTNDVRARQEHKRPQESPGASRSGLSVCRMTNGRAGRRIATTLAPARGVADALGASRNTRQALNAVSSIAADATTPPARRWPRGKIGRRGTAGGVDGVAAMIDVSTMGEE